MEKNKPESLEAVQAKRGTQISTFDKKSRLQMFNFVIPAGSAAVKTFYIELDETYDFCTSMALIEHETFPALTTKDVSITISDDYHNIFNPINYFFWKKSFGYLNKANIFMPCYFRAKTNRITIKINYPGSSVTGMNFALLFKLENGAPAPQFEYNFVQKSYLIDENTTPTPIVVPATFDNAYATIKGFQTLTMSDLTDAPIFVPNGTRIIEYQGSIVMNEIPELILRNSYALNYIDSFFPLKFGCQNKTIDIKTNWINPGMGDSYRDFYLFLVEKAFDPTRI